MPPHTPARALWSWQSPPGGWIVTNPQAADADLDRAYVAARKHGMVGAAFVLVPRGQKPRTTPAGLGVEVVAAPEPPAGPLPLTVENFPNLDREFTINGETRTAGQWLSRAESDLATTRTRFADGSVDSAVREIEALAAAALRVELWEIVALHADVHGAPAGHSGVRWAIRRALQVMHTDTRSSMAGMRDADAGARDTARKFLRAVREHPAVADIPPSTLLEWL